MKVISLFTNVIVVGIICFGYDFYKLWLPNSDTKVLTILTIITLLGSVVGNTVNVLFNVFTITNKVKVNSLSVLGTGFISILIVYILLKLHITSEPVLIVASISVIIGLIKNALETAKKFNWEDSVKKMEEYYKTVAQYEIKK